MSSEYVIDPEVNCIFIRHVDEFEQGEDLQILDNVTSAKEYRRGMNFLRGLTQISLPDSMTDEGFLAAGRQRILENDQLLGKCRVAAVLSNSMDFRTVHRWMTNARLSVSVERHPFRDLDRAMEWLGLPIGYKPLWVKSPQL